MGGLIDDFTITGVGIVLGFSTKTGSKGISMNIFIKSVVICVFLDKDGSVSISKNGTKMFVVFVKVNGVRGLKGVDNF